MASLPTEKVSKFRLENNVFISVTEEIKAGELQEYIVDLVKSGVLPIGTAFYLVGGIHHDINKLGNVTESKTDFTLLHGFYHKIYTSLINLKTWDKMNYDYELVPITCSEQVTFIGASCHEAYQLSEISKREILKLTRKLLKRERPSLIVFASCFSFESAIKHFLYSKGVMASLSISYDKGQVSDGKQFSLDQDQQDIIKKYDKASLIFIDHCLQKFIFIHF